MKMMNSSCNIAGCVDAQTPMKVSFVKLYRWAEADAEFLRMISMQNERDSSSPNHLATPIRDESYASRQRYLRSYTFSKKETVAQKTKKWFKEKHKSKEGSASGSCAFLDAVFKFLFACVATVDVHTQESNSSRKKTAAPTLLS